MSEVRKRKAGEPQYRTAVITREAINQETRTVELAFSSETPVQRYWGNEILVNDAESCNLSRLLDGAPLLANHDSRCQIGVVERAEIGTDRIGRCAVRFSKNEDADEIFRDVCDGIRTKVSVGYSIDEDPEPVKGPDGKIALDGDGLPTYRVTAWTPLEVSMVSIPADNSVGVGRSFENTSTREKVMDEVKDKTGPTPEEIRVKAIAEAKAEASKRNTEILATAKRFEGKVAGMSDLRDQAIREEWSVEKLQIEVLERMSKNGDALKVADHGDPTQSIPKRDLRNFSVTRAIRQIGEFGRLDGLEAEVNAECEKVYGRKANGFFIPNELPANVRALQSDVATSGGFTVDTQVMGGQLIELLRNRTKVIGMGARVLGGLTGNVAIPRVTGGATAYWLSETGSVSASDQAFGQVALVPHRLIADTAYTKELLIQSSIDVEGYVREDIMRVSAIALDLAALRGLGSSGQPMGVALTPNVGSVSFGAAATWAKLIDFETQVAAANADAETMGWIISPATRAKWRQITKIATSQYSDFLFQNDKVGLAGEVNGYRAEVSNQLTPVGTTFAHQVIFGNWPDMILAQFGGTDVVVDPYSLKKAGQVEVTVQQWWDVGIRHAASFTISSDSGAQ